MNSQENPIIGQQNLIIELDSRELCQEVIMSLISQAKKSIALFTPHLEPDLYNRLELCQSLQQLIRKNRQADIRILCKDTSDAVNRSHCLIGLAQNFSSFVEIRKPTTKDTMQFRQSWLLIDDVAYCKIQNVDRYIGSANFNDKLSLKESLAFFNLAWGESSVDQKTRRLSL